MSKLHVVCGIVLYALISSCSPNPQAPDTDILINNVSIIDVSTGAITNTASVAIVDGKVSEILEVGAAGSVNAAQTIEGEGAYLIPGLWDMHTHVVAWGWEYAFPRLLMSGVLGIRDMGWGLEEPAALRERIENGDILGPRMFTVGPIIDGAFAKDFPYRLIVETPADVSTAMKKLTAARVDFIKVHGSLSRDVYFELTEQAKAAGLRIVGHVPSGITATEASNAGQYSIEHLFMHGCDFDISIDKEGTDDALCDEDAILSVIETFKTNNTWSDPTLSVYNSDYETFTQYKSDYFSYASGEDPRRHGRDDLPQSVIDFWKVLADKIEPFLPPVEDRPAAYEANFLAAKRMVKLLSDSGVQLMVGTDTAFPDVYPGGSVHTELALLVEAGLSPLQALQAGTKAPAQFVGLEKELGAIVVGAEASFVLLRENPLENIENTETVKAIVLRGAYYDVAAIDSAY